MFSCSREALELRDPVRGTMALLGSVILLFIMGYGINMDVEDVRYAARPGPRLPARLCTQPRRVALVSSRTIRYPLRKLDGVRSGS
jgi:hypothetical protein